MSASLPTLLALLAVVTFTVMAALVGIRYGDRMWNWVYRRVQGEAEYLLDSFARMFKTVSLARCQLMVLVSSALFGVGAYMIIGHLHLAAVIIFVGLAAWAGWKFPRLLMRFALLRWKDRFEAQLVDGLTMVSNGLRAGLSFLQALDLMVKEMPSPISDEFGVVLSENRMGTRLEEALERLSQRVPSVELRIVVDAVLILRETGGNLSEIFDTIVETMRERQRVQGRIKTLTAQGLGQGIILISMPFVLAWVLYLLNPDYMRPMFTTVPGWIMLGFMCAMLFGGAMIIRKIITIDV